MEQQSMKSSRRGNSLEGSKFILLQAVGEIQSIDPQPEVSAFGARARSSPSSVDRRSLSFSSISSTLQSSRRHLGFSLAREPLLFFGIRGVECVRSSASWPGYGGECEECHIKHATSCICYLNFTCFMPCHPHSSQYFGWFYDQVFLVKRLSL